VVQPPTLLLVLRVAAHYNVRVGVVAVGFDGQLHGFHYYLAAFAAQGRAQCHHKVLSNGIVGNALARHREYLALKKLVAGFSLFFQGKVFLDRVAARL